MLLFFQFLILVLVLGGALYLVWQMRKKEKKFLEEPTSPPQRLGPSAFDEKLKAANQKALEKKKNQNLT